MKNISDYDFSRISAFIDGELDAKEINCLIADMQTKPELKDLYFSLLELSEVSENLKPLGFKERLSKLSLQDLIAAANSSRLLTEVKGKSISAGPRLFCRSCRTISSSKVLEPSPISSSETSETVEKKTGAPNPKIAKSTARGKETMLPSLRCLSVSKFDNMFDYSSFT